MVRFFIFVSCMKKIKAAIIGFGRIGEFYLQEILASGEIEASYICDVSDDSLKYARKVAPGVTVTNDARTVFADPEVDLVIICALADSRLGYVRMAAEAGKAVVLEKPIADTLENEAEVVRVIRGSGIPAAVNLYLRNSWYHAAMKEFVGSGEIGSPAIIRICHMTPGLAPGEGHEFEGPCFHDCGMHYVDIARWYAGAPFKTWHAQGVRMWNWKDPWWIQAGGTFENGIVFDITQGFVYGQLSKDQTHESYAEVIGTKGTVRMTHDFKTARVEMRGVSRTVIEEKPFGGKNLGALLSGMAAVLRGSRPADTLPSPEDALEASRMAWTFIDDARMHDLPTIGTESELEDIRARRSSMTDGYGLLKKRIIIP